MDEQHTTALDAERSLKAAAFIYPKATEDTFCTIIMLRPQGGGTNLSEEIARIPGVLPESARGSTGAAALHAMLKGLEWLSSNAAKHDISRAFIFSDIRHLVSSWENNHSYWIATGDYLLRSGESVKEEAAWRIITEFHLRVPLNILTGTAKGRDYTATIMRIARDAAVRVRESRVEVAA